MRVERYTSAYGYNRRSRLGSGSYQRLKPSVGGVIPYSHTNYIGHALRMIPKSGNYVGRFRLPTNWGMVAMNVKCDPYDYECVTGTYTYRYKGDGGDSSHGMPRLYGVSILGNECRVNVSANTLNRARSEALAKLGQGDFSIGLALAESRMTVNLLAKTLLKLSQAIFHARRGRWSRAGKILGLRGWKDSKSLSDSWLEYQYGFKPLINDVYSLQEAAKEGFLKEDQLFKVTRQVTESLDPHVVFLNKPSWFWLSGRLEEVAKVAYYQKIDDAHLAAYTSLGCTNPALIVWELVPFSFVIDWVVPVGVWLEGISATQGLKFVSGYEDLIIRYDLRWDAAMHTWTTGKFAHGTAKQNAFQRLRKLTWDYPVPYWKNPLSTTHVISALALLRKLK